MNRLTATIICFVLLTLAALAFAGVPQTINYQGYLKTTDGAPATGPLGMTFSLYSSNPPRNDNHVWRETQTAVNLSNGIYSVQLGSVAPITAPFDAPYWLGVKVAGDDEMALQPLSSVPYAMRAVTADTSTTVSGLTLTQLDSRYISPTEPRATPQQIATLRWDQVSGGINSYTVGTNPYALAFDGSSIWVANGSSNNVMKINPANGAIVGTYPVGANPYALAFDGSNIWVANWSNNNVMKINPANGAVVGTYPVGTKPYGLAFDGSNIWVSNIDSHNVTKIDSVNGAIVGTYPVGTNPYALAFDGSSVWVANITSNDLTKINPANGEKVATYPIGSTPYGLVYDGSNIWVANRGSNNIMKIDPTNGAIVGTYSVGTWPWALAFAGGSIWVSNYSGSTVMRIDPANGAILGTYSAGSSPVALAFDGSSIWVANYDSNSVSRLLHAGLVIGPATVGSNQLTPNSVDAFNIIDGAVSTSKIADGSVSDAKISGTISAAKLDLSSKVAKTGDSMTGTLAISTNSGNTISAMSNGTGGNAGVFQVQTSNPTSGSYAINAISNGSGATIFSTASGNGPAGYFEITKSDSASSAINAVSNAPGPALSAAATGGSGAAGYFYSNNSSNFSPALIASNKGASSAFYAESQGSGNAIYATATGVGSAGWFEVNEVNNGSPVIYARTSGIGSAGGFSINNVNNGSVAFAAATQGTGSAGSFTVYNQAGSMPALQVQTLGTGRAGSFSITNAENSSDALYISTNGTGRAANIVGNVQINGDTYISGTLSAANLILPNNAIKTDMIFNGAVTDDKIGGIINDSKLSSNVALLNTTQTFTGAKTFSTTPGFSASTPFTVTSPTVVNNLNADQLDGQHGTYYLNAGNLTGSLSDLRLSTNVALLNSPQTFTGTKTFSSNTLLLNGSGGSTTLNSSATVPRTLALPDVTGMVITTGNLSGISSTGTITSGTWNGGVIGSAWGGTGIDTASVPMNSLLNTTGRGVWGIINAPTATSQVLQYNGSSLSWGGVPAVTSISSGTGLTGGTITSSGTIAIDTTVVPRLNVANSGSFSTSGNISTSVGNITLPATSASGSAGIISFGGTPVIHTYGNNFFAGPSAGNLTTTGSANVAIGNASQLYITDGTNNTSTGSASLLNNLGGSYNTSAGSNSLSQNNAGSYNTAFGSAALNQNIGGTNNTAVGYDALLNSNGNFNTVIGASAGGILQSGSYNIYLGNNILAGSTSESNTIRIGNTTNQNRAFIAGISGVTSTSGAAVYVNSSGQLGTFTSSRRYKEDIIDMGDVTDALMKLRPVSFYYKPEYADGQRLQQFGLIAEEVAAVYPNLVQYNDKGEVITVYYQFVNAMLLNEVQKQHRRLDEQQTTIDQLKAELAEIRKLLGR